MTSRDIYESTFDEDVQHTSTNTCPECDGRVTANVHETVCDECGLVLNDETIDRGPEWRAVGDDSRRRTGGPNTVARHDRGIGSTIGRKTDAKGRTVNGRKRRQLQRLRREHSRARVGSKADRNRIMAFTEIRRMVGALEITTSLRDQACQLFRTAQDAGLLPGRSIEAFASACLYAVCRIDGNPRTFEEVASVSKVSQDRIEHGYSVLNRELGLPVPPADPRAYLAQLASSVDADPVTERTARDLLAAAADTPATTGKKPAGVAAGALYLAAQRTGAFLTQSTIADAADVSMPTVRARYRGLEGIEPA
jgi:transcription initiation factor TFIIB